jgi:hypothetical protein
LPNSVSLKVVTQIEIYVQQNFSFLWLFGAQKLLRFAFWQQFSLYKEHFSPVKQFYGSTLE